MKRRVTHAAGRIGALARRVTGSVLVLGPAVFVAGCGGGSVVAPVRAPTELVVPGRDREHVVGKGDTLYSIAWRFGVDHRTLARANSIREPYTIFPGQRLLVPGSEDTAATEPAGAAASEPGGSNEVSIRGTGTASEPAVVSLPPPLSTGPASATVEQPPKPLATPPKPPTAQTAAKLAASSSSAARSVAGVRWMRPTRGKTISTFGRGGNKGIDIGGTFGQPVRAAAPGRVVYAGSGLIGYGKLVIVKHDNRILSAYAHNERLHVGEGAEVKGGQHIADMGRSGKGRTMLHFEIRRDGKPVDPLRYLP
ncbi:MAG: peptidoglycan DD-metalloendopeptidase family protein [Thiotrichales bacterium]|nr:peptidoglycan DD-metalloendopeptidase family protein [Thiotrichales bacterium]MCY4285812.1 peptidoglycan DD-metalloendopeptidase family protein [Thiotrichales bacterium]MCY4349275.1 peptidoglycan DD-metalloendopeptidase family protein [Thiotrichales bacterium]